MLLFADIWQEDTGWAGRLCCLNARAGRCHAACMEVSHLGTGGWSGCRGREGRGGGPNRLCCLNAHSRQCHAAYIIDESFRTGGWAGPRGRGDGEVGLHERLCCLNAHSG